MKQLVAYITSGFPDKNFSIDVALSLKESGADMLELGIPFSDPVADGPIIEAANLKALQNGFSLNTVFDISQAISKNIDTLWMGYFNPFYHKGFDFMAKKAQDLGVSGFIIPDLPHEETLPYLSTAKEHNVALISFVAPTDSKERIEKIIKNAQKFIYLVAYAGITGSGVSEDLTQTIGCIKEVSKTPLFVGFGVNAKTAQEKAKGVDGVIVGSAFVEVLLDEKLKNSEKIAKISSLAKEIKEKINS